MGIKQLGLQADQSAPSSAKVKNVWSYTATCPICLSSWRGTQLKAQGQLYLYLYFYIFTQDESTGGLF
jgi:hypothetical protein